MKKLLIAFALVSCSILTNAQATDAVAKGTRLLGGNAGFNSSKQGDAKETSITIAPNIGYFVANKWAVGGMAEISSDKPDGVSASTYFVLAPFVRYYFAQLGANAALLAHGSFGFGSYKPGGGSSQSFTQWQLAAGPSIFLNQFIALEILLYYQSQKYKDADDAINDFGLKIGFQIHFGNGGGKKK